MSKSTKRLRNKIIPVRVNEKEGAAITALAEKLGISPGAIVRQTLLNVVPGRGTRRRSVDTKLLGQVLAEMGKIGSNINQIAYHLNAGRPGDRIEGRIDDALRELLEWRTAVMQAIGAERNRKIKD
jgi:Bacterial mobilisation protein (MobC)